MCGLTLRSRNRRSVKYVCSDGAIRLIPHIPSCCSSRTAAALISSGTACKYQYVCAGATCPMIRAQDREPRSGVIVLAIGVEHRADREGVPQAVHRRDDIRNAARSRHDRATARTPPPRSWDRGVCPRSQRTAHASRRGPVAGHAGSGTRSTPARTRRERQLADLCELAAHHDDSETGSKSSRSIPIASPTRIPVEASRPISV